MRLRNIKGAQDIISKSPYLLTDYENYKGKFKDVFNNTNNIEIEIGMGKGNFIIEKAKQNPNINFIGIEKYATVLVSALKKLENIDLPNLKIINMDANFIDDVFERNEMINRMSIKYNVSKQTIRNYLCKYLAYQDISCLLKHQHKKKELSQDEKNFRYILNKYFYTSAKRSLYSTYLYLLREKCPLSFFSS